ncbi:MAG: cytochrome c biogenesis protein CcsA [Bdellovibrionales bacterium]|nr:cytochrome c biogenesis protein CcsA [Bdellovibrionales bacterium]
MRHVDRFALLLALGLAAVAGVSRAEDAAPATRPEPREGWDFSEAERIPLQAGGRLKPMDSFGLETILFLTGRSSFGSWNSTELLLSLLSRPEAWQKERIIRVDHPEARRQLLLEESRALFAPEELFHSPVLMQYAQSIEGGGATLMDPRGAVGQESARERELKKLLNRLGLFRSLVSGEAWTVIPVGPGEAWKSLAAEGAPGPLRENFANMVRAYHRGDRASFEAGALSVRAAIESAAPGWTSSVRRLLGVEVVYHRLQPFRWAFLFYLASCGLWIWGMYRSGRGATFAMGAALAGLLFHVAGFTMRIWISGRAPVSNMYESVIWVSFGAILFSLIIYFVQKQKQAVLMATSTAVSGIILLAADASPAVMDPTIQPLVPVLRSNFWLMVHVLTITLGYAAFALTFGLGNVTLAHFLRYKGPGKPAGLDKKINSVNQLSYRAMQIGVVLLAAGTILGGVWADYSWGRFWGWDPKETWALIALLAYLAVLHARFTGWVGPFGYAAWSVVCFLTVMMAWYGVNYVLGVGLHSYGFSTGGVGAVAGFCLAQMVFVLGVTVLVTRRSGELSGRKR